MRSVLPFDRVVHSSLHSGRVAKLGETGHLTQRTPASPDADFEQMIQRRRKNMALVNNRPEGVERLRRTA